MENSGVKASFVKEFQQPLLNIVCGVFAFRALRQAHNADVVALESVFRILTLKTVGFS